MPGDASSSRGGSEYLRGMERGELPRVEGKESANQAATATIDSAFNSTDRLAGFVKRGENTFLVVQDGHTGMGVVLTPEGGFVGFERDALKPVAELHTLPESRAGPMETKWTPLNGPGPLDPKTASTFRTGTYTEKVLQEDVVLYRAYGGKAGELGKFWTRERPAGPYQAAIDSAIEPKWGNTLEKTSVIRVPKGTKIYEGVAAPQGGLVGGGNQIVIESVDPSWRVKE